MTESGRGYLGDNIHDFFETSEKVAGQIVQSEEQLNENNGAHVTSADSPEREPKLEKDDPYVGFSKMKNDPNEGMVIIQLDNGGPRLKRRKSTEIVIPVDHVSSSESIYSPEDSDSSFYSDISSDTDEATPVQSEDNATDRPGEAFRTDGCISLSSPVRSSQYDLKNIQSRSVTPSDATTEIDNSGSGKSLQSRVKSVEVASDATGGDHEDIEHKSDDVSMNDAEDSADEEGTHSTKSSSSDADSNGSSSVGLSRESFLNICQKFKHVSRELDEIAKAREQLGRHILRTREQQQMSNFVALRMYSSLSANYKLRNIGYVQDTRPNSATVGAIVHRLTPAVGDTFEIRRGNVTSFAVNETPTENSGSSPICSTRFDFTPAARSKIEGAITACSDPMNRDRSVESGRKNPQAKQDSEVRCAETKEKPFPDLQLRRPHQVLPPISRDDGNKKCLKPMANSAKHLAETLKVVGQPSIDHQTSHRWSRDSTKTRKVCKPVKPGIPHQLRSVACYQDGKVDVSITGDKRILPEDKHLNVNITFVHRPGTDAAKKVKVTEAADERKEIRAKIIQFPPPGENNAQIDKLPLTTRRALPPLKNPPKYFGNKYGQQQNLGYSTKTFLQGKRAPTSKKDLPPLRNIPEKMRKDFHYTKAKAFDTNKRKSSRRVFRGCDYLNWDIVNDRAQRPPFNTHINSEASERHQKRFADISV